jgi:hypothetical protein
MRILKAGAATLLQRWGQLMDAAHFDDLPALERAKLITALATAGRGVAALYRDVAQLEPEELVPLQAPPAAPPPAAPDPAPDPTPNDLQSPDPETPNPGPLDNDMMDDLPAPSELEALPDAAVRHLVAERIDALLEPCDTKGLDREPQPCRAAPLRRRELADEGQARTAPA